MDHLKRPFLMLQVKFSALEKLPFFEKSPTFTRGRSFSRGWCVLRLPGLRGHLGAASTTLGLLGRVPEWLLVGGAALGAGEGAGSPPQSPGRPAHPAPLPVGSVSVLGTQLQATRLVWRVESPTMSSLVPPTAACPGQHCSRGEGVAGRRTRRYRPV